MRVAHNIKMDLDPICVCILENKCAHFTLFIAMVQFSVLNTFTFMKTEKERQKKQRRNGKVSFYFQ